MATAHPALSLRRSLDGAVARLWCIPHAGGGASGFRAWRAWLEADGIELCPLQLPGREERMRESPLRDLGSVVEHVDEAMASVPPLPSVLLGHSMGALVAWRAALSWQRAGRQPVQRLLVSGFGSPSLRDSVDTHWLLPDPAFRAFLIEQGGVPPELAAEPALLDLFLAQLRADYTVVDCYVHEPVEALRLPAEVLGASDDPVSPADRVRAWEQLLDEPLFHWFEGGHFFLYDAPPAVRAAVLAACRSVLPASAA